MVERGYSPTNIEKQLEEILKEIGAEFSSQFPSRFGFVIDFAIFLPQGKTAIEVDGPYHDNPKSQKRDRFRDHLLRKEGWEIHRIHFSEFDDSGKLKAKLRKLLEINE